MMTLILSAVAVIAVVAAVFLALIWRRVVPTNQVHIVQSRKKTTIHGHGHAGGNVYYKIPAAIPRFGITMTAYPLSVFAVSLSKYSAYDVGRLPFVVDVTAFFRIENPERAAERVANFQELQSQLTEVLEGTVRRVLATNKLEDIMEDRAKLGEEFTEEVKVQLTEWGVTAVKMIEFMDIQDAPNSSVIEDIMAKEKSRIDRESRETVASNKQLAETKEIEAQRAIAMSRLEAEQTVGEREAAKNQQVGIAQERSFQEVQVEKRTSTQKEMEVREVQEVRTAEIQRGVAVVKADEQQKVALINANASKQQQVINATAIKESDILKADGELQATLKEAEGIEAVGKARAESERLMLHAPVDAQIKLATEIGANEGYQQYLISIRKVEADENVGKEMAGALKEADIKVIANGGSVQGGIGSIGDILGSNGGTQLASMVEAFRQTPAGKEIVDKVVGKTVE